jgi:hypothetical protein
MLSKAQVGASAVGITSPRAIRCQLAPIVRFALDIDEARLLIRDAFRDSVALLERDESSFSKRAVFAPE